MLIKQKATLALVLPLAAELLQEQLHSIGVIYIKLFCREFIH